jgi:hypothetical protein
VLLGVRVEGEKVSPIAITVAQWGQPKPVTGAAVGWIWEGGLG